MNNDSYEDILAYDQIMEYLSQDNDEGIVWKFKDIIGHKGPINKTHPEYKGCNYNVTVQWENGETLHTLITKSDGGYSSIMLSWGVTEFWLFWPVSLYMNIYMNIYAFSVLIEAVAMG